MNIAYRWFLGYLLNESVPHFATISYNFCHRSREDTIEKIFTWILSKAHRSRYLSPEMVFIDGTHIKTNATINQKMKKAIPAATCQGLFSFADRALIALLLYILSHKFTLLLT